MSTPHPASPHLQTIRDLIRYAVSQFREHQLCFGHGSDNAWDEAVYLCLFSLHLPLDQLDDFIDAHVLPEEKARCLQLINARVQQRIPLAYLTGEAWLQGYRFIVTPDVIVPRSPISELLVQSLSPWVADSQAPLQILDMCTGSGNLAILAALHFPHAHVDAVDISPQAVAVAQRNIADYQLGHQVHTHLGDMFTPVADRRYDIIICNPPYVNSTSMQALPEEYRQEPKLALAGGEDGMDFIRQFLHQADKHLNDNGFILLEIGNEYENFLTAFPSIAPTWLDTENSSDSLLLLNKDELRMLD